MIDTYQRLCRFLLVSLNIDAILAEVTIRQRRKKLENITWECWRIQLSRESKSIMILVYKRNRNQAQSFPKLPFPPQEPNYLGLTH